MKTALWVLLIAALLAILFYFLPSVDFAAGQSLEDTVRDSEGGRMPSREEFQKRVPTREGESDTDPRGADVPGDQHPTPPGGSDGGAAGRLLAPPTIYTFFGWAADGRFLGGKNFDTAEECAAQLEQDRARYPRVQFSLCAMLWAERETL